MKNTKCVVLNNNEEPSPITLHYVFTHAEKVMEPAVNQPTEFERLVLISRNFKLTRCGISVTYDIIAAYVNDGKGSEYGDDVLLFLGFWKDGVV